MSFTVLLIFKDEQETDLIVYWNVFINKTQEDIKNTRFCDSYIFVSK